MPSTHTSLHHHVVFSTKEREAWFDAGFREKLHEYLGGSLRALEAHAHISGGVADHVHLLFGLKATHCLADVMRELKSVSSSWVKEQLRRPTFAWQEGYGAFMVCAPDLSRVRDYVRHQEKHHRKQSFQNEYVSMLKRGLVEYDDRIFGRQRATAPAGAFPM